MSPNELQQQIFLFIKERLPNHLSLAEELHELLHISADSVYRRIRGEKPVSLPELKLICEHFHLSLDEMLQLKNESVLFHAPGMNGQEKNSRQYLEQMLAQFQYFISFSNKKMHYLCKDLPFWYFYLVPGVAAFKTFLWKRTIYNEPELQNKKFSYEEFAYPDHQEIGLKIIKLYNLIPSVELYNHESINSTVNQISYYREAGLFANRKEENLVIDSFHDLLYHLEQQAIRGFKFDLGGSDLTNKEPLEFYVNELILGNNTILLQLNEQRLSLITYNVLSYLTTPDQRFAEKAFSSFNSLLSKSTLISGSGEKDRHRFFNGLHTRVEALRR